MSLANDFDYTISDTYYNDTLTLNNQSVRVTGAGVDQINANGASYVEVENTTAYERYVGGIGEINLNGTSSGNVSGGEIHGLFAYDTSVLNVTGGSITDTGWYGNSEINISDGYVSGLFMNDNAAVTCSNDGKIRWINISNDATAAFSGGSIETISSYQYSDLVKHITLICEVGSVNYDELTNLLTGNWLNNGGSFSITLKSHSGYDSAYSNIQFIPEPATLALLAFGCLLIRRKK